MKNSRNMLYPLSFLIAGFFLVGSVLATERQELWVPEGHSSSTAVLAGDYPAAIEIALNTLEPEQRSRRTDRFVSETVLCVAYAKTEQIQQALGACDNAVRLSKRAARRDEVFFTDSSNKRYTLEEIAQSNLALVSRLVASEGSAVGQ